MSVSFIKKGTEATAEIAKADAKQEAAKAGGAYRFWLPDEGEASITFLDGSLTEEGLLELNMWYEHQVHMNGHWRNWFICTQEFEPCPVCEGGDQTPALVGAFTVIDHSEYKDKQQNMHKDEVRLFIAKRNTLKLLQKIATKREGLAGCTFDVTRTGENAANVGSHFDFSGKKPVPVILKKWDIDGPLNYQEVVPYKDADTLRELGFGSMVVGSAQEAAAGADYSKEL